MVSAADREKARRLAVEKAYVQPEPVHDWADAAPTDRPSKTVDAIVAAARAKGWTVQEKARYDWHLPAWVTDPDGGPASYVAKHRVQYHLFAQHPAIDLVQNRRGPGVRFLLGVEGGKPLALDLLLIDGAKVRLRVGVSGRTHWTYPALAISSVAKLIREEGIKA